MWVWRLIFIGLQTIEIASTGWVEIDFGLMKKSDEVAGEGSIRPSTCYGTWGSVFPIPS